MKLEHLAMNVADPKAVADWYVRHLGMRIVRGDQTPPFTHFLADAAGMMIELYNNPPDLVPPYAAMDPLLLHVAFVSQDPEADRRRLETAGARTVTDLRTPDGSHLVMMRDPWGLAIQLCNRARPMV